MVVSNLFLSTIFTNKCRILIFYKRRKLQAYNTPELTLSSPKNFTFRKNFLKFDENFHIWVRMNVALEMFD